MLKPENTKVLIIGSGAAGLSTALFLNKAGIDCEVFEGAPAERKGGAGFVLTPNGINVLNALGFTTELEQYSYTLEKEGTYSKNNEKILSMFASANHVFGNKFVTIQRQHLIQMLLNKMNEAGIPITYDKKVINFEQDHQGVDLFFTDGTSARGHLLVGADGIHSKIRERIFPDIKPKYTDFYGIFGIASSKFLDEEITTEAKLFADVEHSTGVFVSKSMPDDTDDLLFQFLGKAERKIPAKNLEGAEDSTIKEWLRQTTADWKNPFTDVLDHTNAIQATSVYELENMNHWYHGKVVLVGDALHGTNPLLGLGTSWALEDGMYLAKMLKEHGYRDAFHYYEYDRKPMVESMKKLFDNGLNELFETVASMNLVYNNKIEW